VASASVVPVFILVISSVSVVVISTSVYTGDLKRLRSRCIYKSAGTTDSFVLIIYSKAGVFRALVAAVWSSPIPNAFKLKRLNSSFLDLFKFEAVTYNILLTEVSIMAFFFANEKIYSLCLRKTSSFDCIHTLGVIFFFK
jgi:hypothetical protein